MKLNKLYTLSPGAALHALLRLVVGLSVLVFIYYGNYLSAVSAAGILFLMVLPSILKERFKIFIPFSLELSVVVFIFASLFLGSLRNYYELYPLWDTILHFQSGLLLGLLAYFAIYALNAGSKKNLYVSPLFVSVFAVCFSTGISVLWEIYEYLADTFFGYNMQRSGVTDTIHDLILNLVGALIIAIVGYVWMKKSKQLPLSPKSNTEVVE